jgi:hypothetical protein
VRIISEQGVVTEFRLPGFTNDPNSFAIRTMDCMDCHNRPAHIFKAPSKAVNLAMSLGKIDPALPWIKTNAVYALTRAYTDETQALQSIATILHDRYRGDARIKPVIDVVQGIYRDNFFPEMKASWETYPDHIGHMIWSGCFRCHDDRHVTADGTKKVKANDCNACHTILAQGSGEELKLLAPGGLKFRHPGGDEVEGGCNDCHTGGL